MKMVYLDNAATTKLSPAVLDEMMPFLTNIYGNPSSPHYFGQQTAAAVTAARFSRCRRTSRHSRAVPVRKA